MQFVSEQWELYHLEKEREKQERVCLSLFSIYICQEINEKRLGVTKNIYYMIYYIITFFQ